MCRNKIYISTLFLGGFSLHDLLLFLFRAALVGFGNALEVLLFDFLVERGTLANLNKPTTILWVGVGRLHAVSPQLQQGGLVALRTRRLFSGDDGTRRILFEVGFR